MINVVCGVKSTGRICTDLAAALEARGHEVKIAYGREAVPEEFARFAVRIGSDWDVRLHGLRARALDGSGRGSKAATERFLRWVQEFDPGVIHLHNIHGYYINVELLFRFLKTCGKRVIWTLHDGWAFTGHSPYCDTANCERWVEGCRACPLKGEYPKSLADRSGRNWRKKKELFRGIPDLTIVTPSAWLAERVRRSFLGDYPVRVIRNGIDTALFSPTESDVRQRLGVGARRMVLGVASPWNEMKGYSDFLRLAERLGGDYRVVLVGVTGAQREALPPEVIGLERTNSPRELAELYTAADVFVNLSYCENYPTVNLEALACGTAVVSYDTGGSGESARLCGAVVKKGDVAAAAEAVQKLAAAPKRPAAEPEKLDREYALRQYLSLLEKEREA